MQARSLPLSRSLNDGAHRGLPSFDGGFHQWLDPSSEIEGESVGPGDRVHHLIWDISQVQQEPYAEIAYHETRNGTRRLDDQCV
jgi:hypothetical protein